MRKIIHIDMDAFYASVEQRERPELRGKPVIVGGDPQGRGVVSSASYEARKFGVRSAMSCAQARRLCSSGIFVWPRIDLYRQVSDRIHSIFEDVTDLVEPLSLDEAYLDVTQNHWGEPIARRIAEGIKERIQTELGLTASAGVGPNKFIAKVASDLKKPDGLVVVSPDKVLTFVETLPVERFWGVGPVTAERLHQLGFRTAADIRAARPEELRREFGKFGLFLYDLAFGRDDRPVDPSWDPKSRGTETTFDTDVLDVSQLLEWVTQQSEELAGELRDLKRPAKTVTLKLRYKDFQTITRSKTLFQPTDEAQVIAAAAGELLFKDTEVGTRPVRLIGVSVSGFTPEEGPEQLWLDLKYY